MPRDDWRKARDRSVSRAAKREYAADGKSSYPYVWGDDPPRQPGDRPSATRSGPAAPSATRAVWCVYDNTGVATNTFEYRDHTAADELAERLTRETGAPHYVALCKVAVPASPRPAAGSTADPTVTKESNPNAPAADEPRSGSATAAAAPASRPDADHGGRAAWYHRLWQHVRRLWGSS